MPMAAGFTWAANSVLAAACAPAHRRLLRVKDLRRAQDDILRAILTRNATCEFGVAHGFAGITSADAYRAAVPLSTWADYETPTARIASGEQGVLTTERVRLLEPSSGSVSATKLVPYTRTLKAQFQRGIKPWLHDLYTAYPQLRRGRSYWSITPPVATSSPPPRPGERRDRPPVGFDEDADYLGPLAKLLVSTVFAVPAGVAREPGLEAFLDSTCHHLLAAADLTLVSVWNPSLFVLLLDRMRTRSEDLVKRLEPKRRRQVTAPLAAGDWTAIWPQLGLVSCWADAAATAPAAELAGRLPGVVMQPKGLLATEGFVSLPLVAAGGAVLSAHSHYVEFVETDGRSEDIGPGTVPADRVEVGGRYGVVLTTGGGLYRYRLGDLVEVTGRFGALPVLRFLGRLDRVSDLVGEKLNEAFVTAALAEAGAGDARLVPRADHYTLQSRDATAGLAARVDAALRRNFHYDYARRLGQLGPVGVEPASGSLLDEPRGGRLGDVKPTSLGQA